MVLPVPRKRAFKNLFGTKRGKVYRPKSGATTQARKEEAKLARQRYDNQYKHLPAHRRPRPPQPARRTHPGSTMPLILCLNHD